MRARSVLLAVTAAVALSAVSAKLTLPTRESMSVQVEGELCTSFFGSSLSLFAGFTQDDFTFHGSAIRRASLIDEGFISLGYGDCFGGQASFFALTQWTR